MKKIKLTGDVILSSLFVVVGVVMMAVSAGYGLWDRITPDKGFMPFAASLLMSLSGAAWLLDVLRKQKDGESHNFQKNELFWMLAVPGLCVLVYALLNILGMHTSIALFLLFWFKFVSKFTWKKTIIWTVALSVVFYGIFTLGLGVPFPKGFLL